MTKKFYIGENIALIVKKWGMTKEGLGKRFNISKANFSNYITGSVKFPLWIAIEMEEMTNIPVYRLFVDRIEDDEIPDEPYQQVKNKLTIKGLLNEPKGPGYKRQPASNLADINILIERVTQLTMMINDVPALRDELEKLKKEVEELKKNSKTK